MNPDVSVVMSVFNGGTALKATLESVLTQRGVSLELVVINDGSTDETASILARAAEDDSRVLVLSQPNQGLTRSLIRGCAIATGKYIARQDAGDLSLSGRLKKQKDLLDSDPDLAFVSCGWEMVGPKGELLYREDGIERSVATRVLREPDIATLRTPPHMTVMFRSSSYNAVGGYRKEFIVAQDVDLWLRLAQIGDLAYVRERLLRIQFTLSGISAISSPEQRAMRALIVQAAKARLHGESEIRFLERAATVGRASKKSNDRKSRAAHFVGSMLLSRGDQRAGEYFREAVSINPYQLRSWIKLAQVSLGIRQRKMG